MVPERSTGGRGRSAVSAVFFDLGGVLVHVDLDGAKAKLAQESGRSVMEVDRAIFQTGLKDAFDSGAISTSDFVHQITESLGPDLSADGFVCAWTGMFSEVPETVRLLQGVSSRVPVYVASNTDPLHLAAIQDRFAWMRLFQGMALSYVQGVRKPNASFFTRALETFGLDPSSTLLIDDLRENVEAASRLGMQVVLAQTPSKTVGEVSKLVHGTT